MKKDDISRIQKNGFREYDARWLYPDDINLKGIEQLGKGLGTQIVKKTNKANTNKHKTRYQHKPQIGRIETNPKKKQTIN